jgi:hypothetical protein
MLLLREDNLTEEQEIEHIEDIYERELSSSEELQEQVRNFSLPVNVLKLFHENEERSMNLSNIPVAVPKWRIRFL